MSSAFAQVFSSLRRERGLSQRKAAADLGISQALLSHYENGVREPRLDFVVKACEYYGVSADHILGRTSSKSNPLASGGSELGPVLEKSGYTELVRAIGVLADGLYRTGGEEAADTACRLYALITYRMLVQMGSLNAGGGLRTDMLLASEISACESKLMPTILQAADAGAPNGAGEKLAGFESKIKNTISCFGGNESK